MSVKANNLVVQVGTLTKQVDDACFFVFQEGLALGKVAGQGLILPVQFVDSGLQLLGLPLQSAG